MLTNNLSAIETIIKAYGSREIERQLVEGKQREVNLAKEALYQATHDYRSGLPNLKSLQQNLSKTSNTPTSLVYIRSKYLLKDISEDDNDNNNAIIRMIADNTKLHLKGRYDDSIQLYQISGNTLAIDTSELEKKRNGSTLEVINFLRDDQNNELPGVEHIF